jgi:hypothetical protein
VGIVGFLLLLGFFLSSYGVASRCWEIIPLSTRKLSEFESVFLSINW